MMPSTDLGSFAGLAVLVGAVVAVGRKGFVPPVRGSEPELGRTETVLARLDDYEDVPRVVGHDTVLVGTLHAPDK